MMYSLCENDIAPDGRNDIMFAAKMWRSHTS